MVGLFQVSYESSDFQFTNATVMFENMDILIDYVNAHYASSGITVQYGLLSDYFSAIHALNLTWDVRNSSDFFPYNDD